MRLLEDEMNERLLFVENFVNISILPVDCSPRSSAIFVNTQEA